MCFRREFFHIAGKVALKCIKSPTDISTLFFCQSSPLLAGFLFNFKTVAHRSLRPQIPNRTAHRAVATARRARRYSFTVSICCRSTVRLPVDRDVHPVVCCSPSTRKLARVEALGG